MFKIITALLEIIGGAYTVWKRIHQKPDQNTEIIKRIKDATDIRNSNGVDEQFLLPKDQRDA